MTPEIYAPSASSPESIRARSGVGPRLLSLIGLGCTLFAIGYVGSLLYLLLTDSFVAPIILSKDSDMVVQSKLSLSRLLAERHAIVARMEEDSTAIEAADRGASRLKELREAGAKALDWALTMTGHQTAAGARDLAALSAQRSVIGAMIAQQESVLTQLKAQQAAGMVHKAEVDREEIALQQMRVAALENDRSRLSNQAQRQAALLVQRSLLNPQSKDLPATPEVIARQDQLVKIDLELLKLEAEARAKRLQRASDQTQLDKIDELLSEMKARPIFRAIESSQNVAFVPYTQIDGVVPGARVFNCRIWGLFVCKDVGEVAELVSGEVAAQDPWGTPMRGRYAILSLRDLRSAESQSLRVRIDRHLVQRLLASLKRR